MVALCDVDGVAAAAVVAAAVVVVAEHANVAVDIDDAVC
jgi:hypothetical protein